MSEPHPFLVVGLPRSRTAWLARFLSYGNHACVHEPSFRWQGPDDFHAWLDGREGASDSMMTWLAHKAKALKPDLPLVVIRRSRRDVLRSLNSIPYDKEPWLPAWLERMDQRLDRIEDDLDCLSYTYDQLKHASNCAFIFSHCLGEDMPMSWLTRWSGENVQTDVLARLRQIRENERGWFSVYQERYAEIV